MSIAEKVKSLRKQKGYSQEKLADETGLSLRTIQRVENNETEPRGNTLTQIAEVFKVSPDEILDLDKTEDHSTLLILNLSALCFLIHPILGVIVPLIIWVSRKDVVIEANEIGKKIINFQIAFTAFFYLMKGSLFLIAIFQLQLDPLMFLLNILNIPPILLPIAFYSIPYTYNLIFIILNTFRIQAGERINFKPSIKVIR